MSIKNLAIGLISIGLASCNLSEKEQKSNDTYPDIEVIGTMRNVMWKGELSSVISLDTIQNKKGLYGLGPEAYLTGELLINDGQSFVSSVLPDSKMIVEQTFKVQAPFFVYANVTEWEELILPDTVINIKDLEEFIDQNTEKHKRPFVFKLIGRASIAEIHIQNLPKGKKVSSPDDAHLGQINYKLENEVVEIIGFFSTQHQGVFTLHDSFLHMHLITGDKKQMGHLDSIKFKRGNMMLYLPQK
jgi:acetolactate decarboxylase